MKLDKCLKMISFEQNIPTDWTIRFYDENNLFYDNDFIGSGYGGRVAIPTTIGIDDLYNDWYGDCNSCPENDLYVFGITIAQESTGKCYLIETPYKYTFEQLMREIEKIIYKKQ